MKNGYLLWNFDTNRVGCWNSKTQSWVVEGFHCGDCFIVADGKGFSTAIPEKWTSCHLERLDGEWEDGAGFVLVNEDEPITEPRWIGYREIKL